MSDRQTAPRWLGVRERPYDLHAQPLISIAAAAAIGILTDQAVSLTYASLPIVLTLLAVIAVAAGRGKRWIWVMCATALAMGLRSRADQQAYDGASLVQIITEDAQPTMLRGIVRSDIQRRPALKMDSNRANSNDDEGAAWQTLLIMDVSSVRIGTDWKPFSGGIHVTIDGDFSIVAPGDSVELGGEISRFSPPSNPGESDFRLVARNRRLHARLTVDSSLHARILSSGRPSIRRFIDSLARRGEATLQSSLGEHVGPLACALVVGRRTSMNVALKDRLLETGTIHLLSVSGLHLAIVATAMMSISVLLGLGRVSQVILVGIACALFAAVTGGNPPVLRAAILVATVLTSLLFNRRQWPLNTLAFAALILMLLNPTDITQVGVQLSFVSVATLICCSREMDPARHDVVAEALDSQARIDGLVEATRSRRMQWVNRLLRRIRNAAWLSTCVTLATTPLIWLQFNLVSPVGVLANLLLGLPAAFSLLTGLFAVVGGWVWQPLAIVPAFLCDLGLHAMQWIIDRSSELPYGHAWLPAPPNWWVAAYFVILIGSFAMKIRFNRRYAFVFGSLAWGVVAWLLAVLPSWQARDSLLATFIDVGHGTSVLIELPSGENYLYDCGRLGNYDFSSRGIQDVLWSRGLARIDAVILSHADSDHFNALPGLMRRFRIDEIVIPPGMLDAPAGSLAVIHNLIQQRGIPIREVSIDDRVLNASGSIEVLHPPRIRLRGSDNANSLVVRIDHQGTSFVLPGDLEPPGTEALINFPRPNPGGVLMAPHHGSLAANAEAILDWARPSRVIVSGGSRAKRPEVARSLRIHGSEIAVTATHGAIRVVIRAGQIKIDGYRDSPW